MNKKYLYTKVLHMGATSLWSSFSILEVRLSGPAALPGFSFESCFDTPFTVIFMLGIVGDMSLRGRISSARCFSFNGTGFVKTDWNWPFKIFALSEAFVYVTPFDLSEGPTFDQDSRSVVRSLIGLFAFRSNPVSKVYQHRSRNDGILEVTWSTGSLTKNCKRHCCWGVLNT